MVIVDGILFDLKSLSPEYHQFLHQVFFPEPIRKLSGLLLSILWFQTDQSFASYLQIRGALRSENFPSIENLLHANVF